MRSPQSLSLCASRWVGHFICIGCCGYVPCSVGFWRFRPISLPQTIRGSCVHTFIDVRLRSETPDFSVAQFFRVTWLSDVTAREAVLPLVCDRSREFGGI